MTNNIPQKLSPESYGKLYVVATPIGNLNDFTVRAQKTLKNVSWIACEDTRHCKPLLQHYTIFTPCVSLHNYNELQQVDKLIKQLQSGESGAIVSDAGTPLISDPGFHLVAAAYEHGITVVPIPGSCAVVTALSALAIDKGAFYFDGFLPANKSARCKRLKELANYECQIVFYEAPHRIEQLFEDLVSVYGENRRAGIAREITKIYESFYKGSTQELYSQLKSAQIPQKGEFVVVVEGCQKAQAPWEEAQQVLIESLLPHLPINKVAKITAQLTKLSRKTCYDAALALQDKLEK